MVGTQLADSPIELDHEDINRTVKLIPPLPRSGMLLNRLFTLPNYQLSDVVRAVELDPALSGKLLQLSSGVNYGPRKPASIDEAVIRLGGGTVRSIAMAECMRPAANLDLSFFGMTPASYWKHSVTVVCFAEELAVQHVAEFGSNFSVAAILHDFGKAVIATHLTSELVCLAHQQHPDLSGSGLEHAILGVDHATVSAAVAQGWGLDDDLVQSIRCHHAPELFDHPLCHGLNIANHLAWQLEGRNTDLERESSSRSGSIAALALSQEKLDVIAEQGSLRLRETLEAYS